MTPAIRMAILAGVSSDPQASEEKESIPDQIKTCRRVIEQHRGIETGCYVFDGYSRTGYDSLADAMEDIPALGDAIRAAQENKYDVLVIDNWDRLGDLGQLVYIRFRKYRKQVYSARQSGKLEDPKTYDPWADERSGLDMHIQGILQTYRLNKIRRGWNIGVPARIDKGLHPLSLPFGYRLAGKDQPAVQVPEVCALIVRMKDWMLAGATYSDLCRHAEASGIRPPRGKIWHRNVVKKILLNPFYSGIVRFGAQRKRIPAPRGEWKVGQGKHKPLWDEATHRALVSEARRRLEGKRHYYSRYPFTGLPVCGECGAKISKHGGKRFEYLACKTHRHWAMRYEKAVPYLAGVIVDQFQKYQSAPRVPVDLAPLRAQLEELKTMRARIQHGYETGIYSDQEAATKIAAVEDEAENIAERLARFEQEEREWEERQHHREDVDIAELLTEIQEGDPQEINHVLTELIEKIVLTKDDAVVVWR